MKRVLSAITAGVIAVLAASPVAAQNEIKIGWIGHLTGFLSAYSKDMLTAAEMAVADVNAEGGVLGRKLRLVVRDDRGDPSLAATTMRELDAQEKVLVVAGTLSSDVSRALRGYAEANELPYISTSSGDASITAPGTVWTARIQPPAAVQGAAMSKFALDRNPNAKIAIVRADILYFPELMNGAIWYMETQGKAKQLVYNKYFPPRQADFNVVATQMKEAAPDYILFAFNSPGLENFVRAALGAGFKPEQLICFTVQTAPAQKALGKDIIGTYAATFFDEALRTDFPRAGAISDRFFKDRGYYPGYIAGHAYGNIRMIADALKGAGKVDRVAFKNAFRGTEVVDAAGRKLKFDDNGRNTLNTTYIVQATGFSDTRLATFKLMSSIHFNIADVPALELSNVRK